MTKQELIQKARTAILKGEKEVDGWYIYTAKIDLDIKLDKEWMKCWWEESRVAIIEEVIYSCVVDINTVDTDRGAHTTINFISEQEWDDVTLNFLQLILGDDVIRYKINARRTEKGISFEKANILFSKVLHRYPHEESRLKVALERIIGEIK